MAGAGAPAVRTTSISTRRAKAASSFRATARSRLAWRARSPKWPNGRTNVTQYYIALIDGEHGSYGVVVPDLPGCTSAGETIVRAYRNATEAVRLWVEDAEADGEKLPPPRPLEALRADPEVAAALANGDAIAMVPVSL